MFGEINAVLSQSTRLDIAIHEHDLHIMVGQLPGSIQPGRTSSDHCDKVFALRFCDHSSPSFVGMVS
jgi:hypothetical protein